LLVLPQCVLELAINEVHKLKFRKLCSTLHFMLKRKCNCEWIRENRLYSSDNNEFLMLLGIFNFLLHCVDWMIKPWTHGGASSWTKLSAAKPKRSKNWENINWIITSGVLGKTSKLLNQADVFHGGGLNFVCSSLVSLASQYWHCWDS